MKLNILYAKNLKTINVDANMDISDFKHAIAKLFHINANNINLKFACVIMLEGKPIMKYEITENALIEVWNKKIDLKFISTDSEVILKDLDMNMKIEDLKKKISPINWPNLNFYYRYKYSESNEKKIVDLKIVNERIEGKEDIAEKKKIELKKRYMSKYGGKKLYWFTHEKLSNNNATIKEYQLNENGIIYITFEIYVTKGNSVHKFNVYQNLSISNLKSIITNKIDKSILDFDLTFQGEILENSKKIKDYEIEKGCTLIMTIGMNGG